ncbi:MAG TPA: hypothetical protein VEK08_24680 [Planctomycetota bacterium]|nr:hypothetical protein [Planctomycetota bacterium]
MLRTFVLFAALVLCAAQCRSAETEKKSPVDDDIQRRLNASLEKMNEMDKDWKSGGKPEGAKGDDKGSSEARKRARKMSEDEEKARKKREKEQQKEQKELKSSSTYRPSSSGSYAGSYAASGSVEAGGLTQRSSYSSGTNGAWSSGSSYSSSSIGVSATVIRLD